MKKILMIAATTAMLSTTAFADAENMFYLKANAGANWMNKVTTNGIRIKDKAAPVFMLVAGYYIMDNVRADLSLEMVSNPQLKGSVKHKGNVAALMVNSYVDMFDVSVAEIFAGVGVGASRVKDKATGSSAAGSASDSTKTKLTYQLTVGAGVEMAPGVKAELAYSWRDYGRIAKNSLAVSKVHFNFRDGKV